MKNFVKNLLICVTSLCLIFQLTGPALAVSTEKNTIEGMDRFFSISENGTIEIDIQDAYDAGYSEEVIEKVKSRIQFMNGLVLSGRAYINSDFAAVESVYSMYKEAERSDVVHNWDGTTDVYLSNADVDAILRAIAQAEQGLDYIGILAELATPIQGYVVAIFLGGSVMMASYKLQIEIAAEKGTGIIMHIYNDDTTGMQYISFLPQ